MRGTCTVARENGIPITIHLSESKGDHDYFCSLDHSPSSYVDAVGLLGPSTVLAHAVHVDTAVDIPKFAATGTHVSHCPSSNSKLASGISPVPELLAAGVNVTLGADGAACNNSLDIFQEMKWAAMLQNHTRHEDAASITAETALEMATINGAKALGLDHLIGSLEIGKRADFVAVDVRKVALHPCINPVSNIVYAATGRDVHVVVVDGQVTVEDGKIRTMDEEAIMKMADEALGGLLQRAGLQDQVRSPWPLQ